MTVGNPYDRLNGLLPSDDDLGLDGYEVLAPLGEGGFGRVYRARQPALDRDVAVKVLAVTGVGEDLARRFERECRAVGALSGHPNIVTLHDCGVTRWGRPFIVMEHMAGGSLAQKLVASGAMGWADAVEPTIKIASALETAHRAGILHRDIKPENLLLSAYGEPKLADFGVASIPGGYQTHTGSVTASLIHAAPEILEGGRATRAADIYSLGSTLFALVAGAPAFSGDDGSSLQGLIARIVTQPVPDLRRQGVPAAVCDVIERALSKEPGERFGSAYEMAVALRHVQISAALTPTEIVVEAADAVVYATDTGARADDPSATRLRERRELTPPTIERTSRRFKWRTPAFAATVVLLLSATTGGAIVMNVRRHQEPPKAARAPSGIPEATDPEERVSTPAPERRAEGRGQPGDAPKRDGARDGGSFAFGGPSGPGGSYNEGGYTAGGPDSDGDAPAPTGGSRTSTGQGTNSGESSSQPESEEPPIGNETRATIVLYHHWSDSGEYFFTANRNESEDALLVYDHRHSEGYVWATSRTGDGLIPICYSNQRGCYGFASEERPSSGQYRTLYWYPGARYGHYYSTDPNETYRGEPLSVFGYIRGSTI